MPLFISLRYLFVQTSPSINVSLFKRDKFKNLDTKRSRPLLLLVYTPLPHPRIGMLPFLASEINSMYRKLIKVFFNQINKLENYFLTFPADFWIPIIFSNLYSNCSNLLDMRNLQEQVKKTFCNQKLFWPFTVWINLQICKFSAFSLAFQKFSWSLEQFIPTVKGQNNFW